MTSSFFKLFAPPVQAMLDPTDSSEPPSLRDDVPETIGLLSTPELDSVLEECRSHVARIAQQCRARNLRYRDIDFDIENDQDRCLNGLLVSEVYHPADVQRVSELFEKPRFFVGGPYSNEIIQGQKCSNCWFISALASTSTVKGLVQKYCVARDEAVGVYGFVFWRDMQWVSVIVDDLLYTSVPKYEELSLAEKALFQNDKDQYNASARKGSKTLYFAKSGTVGETWVPLVEKAYAKLHGDYASLASGYASEGVEDLTGGVSSFIQCKDILDRDKFWTSELLKANIDRVFACSFQGLSPTRNGNFNATVNGLWGNHSYAVLRALEYLGRRFLVLRNPCGQAEWNGPWSDGSKNWTPESMEALPALGHVFGDPGKFIMEYKDFLSCFEQVDRTRLFDSSWTMKHEVLRVPSRPFPGSGFGYGDLCFTFSLPKTTFTILVLSQLDSRYFKGIAAPCYWNFDFVLYRRGQKEPVDVSSHSRFTARSVSLEFPELEKGEYVVHCRLDKVPFTDNLKLNPPEEWSQSQSKLSRVITERSNSESVATNVEADFHAKNLPIPLRILAGQDLTDISRKARQLQARLKASSSKDKLKPVQEDSDSDSPPPIDANAHSTTITTITTVRGPATITTNTKEVVFFGRGPHGHTPEEPQVANDRDEDSRPTSPVSDSGHGQDSPESVSPFLGLKVYTHKDVTVSIQGQLRHNLKADFNGLTTADWNSFAI
ncbi:cysteine proteinase [Roridomyces roridus]|uniref:Cysteine proteinase n=1 Tax=Roridomyces roridus TaxID=1738132 RepID=A0AAD7C6Z2_9AGAR|nr:cysteine proteinase [Roridomyces roridus]